MEPILIAAAQVLVGVDALWRYAEMETLDTEHELYLHPVAMKIGYYMKATNRFFAGMALMGLGAWQLRTGCAAYVPMAVAIVVGFVAIEILSTPFIAYGRRGSFFSYRCNDFLLCAPEDPDEPGPVSFQALGRADS